MFTAKDIKELMESKPFKPFKIRMSDGSSYPIPNHDAAMITRNFVEVGINPDADGILEKVTRCSILHITQIEELQPV